MSNIERTHLDVGGYYDQQLGMAQATGAGMIWFMGRDHLSPPLSNIDEFALHPERWRDASSMRVVGLAERMGIASGDVVLDLGCGVGGPARDVAEATGASVIGLSISIAQLGNYRNLSAEAGSDASAVVMANMEQLPVADGSVDHAYSINAIYHVSHPDRVIQEASRALRPGGIFGVDDWFTTASTTPAELAQLRYNWSTSENGFHNIDRFTQAMGAAGLAVREVIDFTQEAGAFLSEGRFGAVYDEKMAPVLLDAFPQLYRYDGYEPVHAEMAVAQLRSDILYMGELYRGGDAVYQQLIGEKVQ
ncbi:MAG TPA: methyltransferase domain-containing protein [Patescibacteria group bacterium]|nr:methyltransferase domain-containing protein [Patescibacteria group bacterium]